MLRESAIDPRNPNSPLGLIIDANMDNPKYLEDKAKELIIEAQFSANQKNPSSPSLVYDEKMQKAIFFLVIARCVRDLMIINQDRV